MTVPLAVTTTGKTPGRFEAEARRKAEAWGLPFHVRAAKSPLGAMLGQAEALLVAGAKGWALVDAQGELGFSPGLGAVRIKRLEAGQGEDDVLLRLLELRPGDTVVDGTLGLAADALVCAHRVGAHGRVLGAEASLPLYALVSEGLAALRPRPPVEVHHRSALELLRSLGARSVDCVMLDPMFDRPTRATPDFGGLRRHAVHAPLDAQTLAEARRVARRWVVVKASRFGREFERLGLTETRLQRASAVRWARVAP